MNGAVLRKDDPEKTHGVLSTGVRAGGGRKTGVGNELARGGRRKVAGGGKSVSTGRKYRATGHDQKTAVETVASAPELQGPSSRRESSSAVRPGGGGVL